MNGFRFFVWVLFLHLCSICVISVTCVSLPLSQIVREYRSPDRFAPIAEQRPLRSVCQHVQGDKGQRGECGNLAPVLSHQGRIAFFRAFLFALHGKMHTFEIEGKEFSLSGKLQGVRILPEENYA